MYTVDYAKWWNIQYAIYNLGQEGPLPVTVYQQTAATSSTEYK